MVSVGKGFRGGLDYRVALRRARRASAVSEDEKGNVVPRSTVGNRTCLVTRVSGPRQEFLRFVVSPQGVLVPDVKGAFRVVDCGSLHSVTLWSARCVRRFLYGPREKR